LRRLLATVDTLEKVVLRDNVVVLELEMGEEAEAEKRARQNGAA
jgi:hypothetical protein